MIITLGNQLLLWPRYSSWSIASPSTHGVDKSPTRHEICLSGVLLMAGWVDTTVHSTNAKDDDDYLPDNNKNICFLSITPHVDSMKCVIIKVMSYLYLCTPIVLCNLRLLTNNIWIEGNLPAHAVCDGEQLHIKHLIKLCTEEGGRASLHTSNTATTQSILLKFVTLYYFYHHSGVMRIVQSELAIRFWCLQ